MKLSSEPHTLTVSNNADCGGIKLNTLDLGKTSEWSGKYHSDYDVTLTAVPEEGQTFSHWVIDGAEITEGDRNSAEISLKLSADATVKAVYEGEAAEEVIGDVNNDGQFNVSDLVLLQKWLLADSSAELASPESADMVQDGVIDVFDLIAMRRALLEDTSK